MRIGLYIRLFGRAGTNPAPPSWQSIREQALAAEAAGFDLVVLEDAALYVDDDGTLGVWEAVSVAAAVAAVTTTIGIAHAVINNPYRHPTLIARIADTIDEISGGRYTLGIGLGNTPDDYPRFGIEAGHRFSRFAEAIQIIQALLRTGKATFEGEFYQVPDAELALRGPRPGGPPIVVAAGKPKMLRLAAQYADEWNWWTAEPAGQANLRELGDELRRACEEVGRDPATLRRSLDLFSVAAPGTPDQSSDAVLELGGSPDEIAEGLLAYRSLGFDEVRCDLRSGADTARIEAIDWMGDVVSRVHEG